MKVGEVKIVPNPAAIAKLSAPGGLVDQYTYGVSKAIAATAQGLAPRDTGALAASITVKRVGPSSWTVVANSPYAMAVHQGTRPHEIRPKNGRVLKFPSRGGRIVYAPKVNHPGTKPNPFLEKAMLAVVKH